LKIAAGGVPRERRHRRERRTGMDMAAEEHHEQPCCSWKRRTTNERAGGASAAAQRAGAPIFARCGRRQSTVYAVVREIYARQMPSSGARNVY